jgi:hypothetical protein
LFRPSVQTIFNDFAIPSALIETPLQNPLGAAGPARKNDSASMILAKFYFMPKADCSRTLAWALVCNRREVSESRCAPRDHWAFILEEVASSAGALYGWRING